MENSLINIDSEIKFSNKTNEYVMFRIICPKHIEFNNTVKNIEMNKTVLENYC